MTKFGMTQSRWRIAAVLLLAASSTGSLAQFPAKAIMLISPFPAGGGPDAYLRPLAMKLTEQIGQSVLIDNRAGGGGALMMPQLARAAADGHTVGVVTNSTLIQKHVQPAHAYDPIADFAQITRLVTGVTVLVVTVNSPVKRVEDLIAHARASPGKLNYGSGGIGTPSHLAAATLQSVANIDTVHIPFKNAGDVVPSLLRGDLHFSFQVASFVVPLIRAGKLRGLAAGSSARMRELPDIPTLIEMFKNDLLAQDTWVGLAAPARTPAEILRRLHAETVKALADPVIIQIIERTGTLPAPSASPEEQQAYVLRENEKWRQIVRLSGVKAE